jgi:hypothetical protein
MFSHRFALIAAAVLALVFSLLPVAPVDGLRPQAGETGPVKGLDSLEAADQEVALSFRQAPLDSILETIGDATGVRFRIRGEVGDRLVDFDTGGERRLVQVLEKLFQTARLSHRVLGPDEVEVMPIAAAGVDDVTLPVLIPESKVDPVYPEQARDRRIQGTVKLQAFIDTDGTVQAVEVLQAEVTQDGEAIAAGDEHDTQYLVTSAMEAVRQWRYEPATKNGVPVPVFLTIQTDFRLN